MIILFVCLCVFRLYFLICSIDSYIWFKKKRVIDNQQINGCDELRWTQSVRVVKSIWSVRSNRMDLLKGLNIQINLSPVINFHQPFFLSTGFYTQSENYVFRITVATTVHIKNLLEFSVLQQQQRQQQGQQQQQSRCCLAWGWLCLVHVYSMVSKIIPFIVRINKHRIQTANPSLSNAV